MENLPLRQNKIHDAKPLAPAALHDHLLGAVKVVYMEACQFAYMICRLPYVYIANKATGGTSHLMPLLAWARPTPK